MTFPREKAVSDGLHEKGQVQAALDQMEEGGEEGRSLAESCFFFLFLEILSFDIH